MGQVAGVWGLLGLVGLVVSRGDGPWAVGGGPWAVSGELWVMVESRHRS